MSWEQRFRRSVSCGLTQMLFWHDEVYYIALELIAQSDAQNSGLHVTSGGYPQCSEATPGKAFRLAFSLRGARSLRGGLALTAWAAHSWIQVPS